MGAWSASISGNDEFQSIYDAFKEWYSEYADHQWPYGIPEIKKKMSEQFAFQLADKDLAHEFWFAQAKGFWDYGIDDDSAFKEVQKIIASGANLDVWRSLDASEENIRKRKKALDDFLIKLSTPNPKPVKRAKITRVSPPFEEGQLLAFQDEAGYYYGAVVTHAYRDKKGRNVVHILNYRSPDKPGKEQLVNTELMVHTHTSSTYITDASANPIDTLMHGFLLDMKGFQKSKISFHAVGNVVFHKYGYYRDGMRSFNDMTKYPWDILTHMAALNYEENSGKRQPALLRFYTEETDFTKKEWSVVLNHLKNNEPVTVLSQYLDPAGIYAWVSKPSGYDNVWMTILVSKLPSMNVFLLKNILRRIMGMWLESRGQTLDGHFFSVDDYDLTPEEGKEYVRKISLLINEVESGSIALGEKKVK